MRARSLLSGDSREFRFPRPSLRNRCFPLVAFVFMFALVAAATNAQEDESDGLDATGDGFVIIDSTISPSDITVGDRVELRVVLRSNNPDEIRLPDDYPSSQSVEIRNMRMIQRDNDDREIRVTFSPFRTGTLTVPDIDLGAGTLSGASFRVGSVLPEDGSAELAPVEAPGFLSGFQVIAFILLVALVSAPFVLYRLAVVLSARLRRAIAAHRANRPYRLIVRAIREISTLFDRMSARDFYIRLVDETREYLSERLHSDFMVATANEVPFLLQERLQDESLRSRLNELFRRADLVKFASEEAGSQQRGEDLETVVLLVALIESRRESRVRRRAYRPVRRLAGSEAA